MYEVVLLYSLEGSVVTYRHQFSSIPHTFFVQRTASKARLFVGRMDLSSTELTPVTTVNTNSDADTDLLVAALKTAAWTGNRKSWETLALQLPAAVVLACNQALAAMPPHRSLMLGDGGVPLTVLRSRFVSLPDKGDLFSLMSGASNSGLQILVENLRDDQDGILCRARLLSGDMVVPREQIAEFWPFDNESTTVERQLFGDGELEVALADERWLTRKARACWVWVVDGTQEEIESGDYSAEVSWVIEYFDQTVPEDTEPLELEPWEQFVGGDWSPWPMTVRTRFVLWVALTELFVMLDSGLGDWKETAAAPYDDDFMSDYPKITWAQPRAWWVSLMNACERLVEAMRTGEQWNPRTPAEEALIYVACGDGWVEAARDTIDMSSSLRRQFAALPEGIEPDFDKIGDDDESEAGADFDWKEVPGALAGDEDIALLWEDDLSGIEHPGSVGNMALRMGDYRAESWHIPFDWYRQDPDTASGLF